LQLLWLIRISMPLLRLDLMKRLILLVSFFCLPALVTTAADPLRPTQQTAVDEVERRGEELRGVHQAIWNLAEVGLEERKSSALLVEKLKSAGFTVEQGISGMPTAFVASYGSGKPVIGILAEYDALPGLSQKASPERDALTPEGPGHGCGHNALGAGA